MAPITIESDFLDDALKNKTILPSWRSIFTRITSSSSPTASPQTIIRISSFLSSPSSRAALTSCHNPFLPPSAASKQEFEKRTALINFTATEQPAAAGTLPPIEKLKGVALSLSKDLNIDEVSALRIVVLEFQRQPAKALLAAQGGDGEFSNIGGLGSTLRAGELDADKEKDQKLLFERVEVYLSERRYVAKVASVLVRAALCGKEKMNVWSEAGRKFVEDILANAGMMERVVDSIDNRWGSGGKRGEGLPSWVKERINDGTEQGQQVAYAWEKQTLTEIIHLLQLLFLLLYRPAEDVSAALVMKWYNLMEASQFFSHREYKPFAGNRDIENLYIYGQGLVSVVSLTMLQLPKVMDSLKEEFKSPSSHQSSVTPPATGPASPPRAIPTMSDKVFYIKNTGAIKAVTQCFRGTIYCPGSSLAASAWVYILHNLTALVDSNDDWGEMDGTISPGRGSDTFNMYKELTQRLFPTTISKGLQQMAAICFKQMLDVTTVLLEPAEQTSAGLGFALSCEEDSLRMKNVIAHLFRKTQSYLELSGNLVAVAFLVSAIEYTERQEFKDFKEHDALPEKSAAAMLLDKDEDMDDDWSGSPARKFWQDEGALVLLEKVKSRFPYEPLPFLQMVRGMATENTAAMEYLTQMNSYTQELPHDFKDYEGLGEEEEEGWEEIILTADLVLFYPRSNGSLFDDEIDTNGVYTSLGGIIVPTGTRGDVISTGGGRIVVAWKFQYNALPLLGRVLEWTLSPSVPNGIGDLGSTEGVTEIVNLFTMLIASSKESAACEARLPGQYGLPQILEDGSDILGRNKDVVSVVFDLLDSALNRSSTADPFFIAGLQFVDSLVHIIPQRVWPFLARCALLERRGRGDAFSRILSSVESIRGTYDFTITCLNLYESLVEEAIRSSAQQTGRNSGLVMASASKQPHRTGTGTGVSNTVQRDILKGFTHVAVDIFESYRGYKYEDIAQKMDIGTRLARIFRNILDYVYGVDESSDKNSKITGVLTPSAEHLVSVFLSPEGSELPLEPILGAITDGVYTPESSLYLKSLGGWVGQVIEVVKLADILVRVRLYLGIAPSQLEKKLYAHSAYMAKLYAADERYKQYVLELFESLVKASGLFPEEPPSLLGHLGAQCASHFVTLLADLDAPYQDSLVETRIWNLISAVVSNKQQGMSILLLRGETLRNNNNGSTTERPAKKKSMLLICMDTLEDIDRLPVEKTMAMLEAVSTAQNFWSLAMDDLSKHPKFLQTITKHVETFTIEFLPADTKEIHTEKAYKIAVAAYIARILALYFHSRQASQRDEGFFKQLLPRLNFYFEKAVKISGYRPSLHVHLQKNFEEKWPGVKLSQIRKTRMRRAEYGPDAMYDVTLGGKVLGFDPSWDGRADGYRTEVEQANVNLSIVQTQVELLDAWKLLAVELCDFVNNSKELTTSLVSMVETCLHENISTGLPAPIFAHIVTQRSEFAFVIVRRLHMAAPPTLDLFSVFHVAWKAIYTSTTDFRTALQTADMSYYRSVLRILYLCLCSIAPPSGGSNPKVTTEFAFTVLNLLDLVIAKGFCDLAQSAHTSPHTSNPADIALITAILQSALRLGPAMSETHQGLATHLAESSTVRAATTLFSWASQLDGDDPMYAELAALFLLELSAAPTIAEHLAVEHTLEHLTSTSLATHIASHTSAPLPPRLHAIWARGLLPLALNLLATIGQRIGRDITAFLRFFRPQLQAALTSWAPNKIGHVTLANVNEVVGIVMALKIVEKLGGKGEVEALGLAESESVAEEGVGYLLQHRNYLASLVVVGEEGGSIEAEVEKVEKGLRAVGGLLGEEEE